MAGDETEIDAASLRGAGHGVHDTGIAVNTRVSGHANAITSVGLTWGDDDISSLIGASYQAIHEEALQSLQFAAIGLQNHGEGIQLMRATHDAAETSSTAGVNSIGLPPSTGPI
jgi:hypothetical protein